MRKDVLSQHSALLLWYEHVSKYKNVFKAEKRKTVTEADIDELIENLDDGEYYPDSGFSDNDDNDENSFWNLSEADQNNRDSIQSVRNTWFPRSLYLTCYQ